MAVNSMEIVYVFLYLSWTVMWPMLLSEFLRKCWDVCLEIKVDWNAEHSFTMEGWENFSFNLTNEQEKSSCVFTFFVRSISVYILVSVTTGVKHLQNTQRNSSRCLSMGLENTYCLFCELLINIAIRGWDGHYFPPSNTTLLLGILKLNDCWLNHKSPWGTNNQWCQSCSYQYLPNPVVWVFQLMINRQDLVKSLYLWPL